MYKWIILFLSILWTGCAEKQPLSKFDVACDRHVVVYDSFTAELLEVDEQSKRVNSLKKISPKNDVIGQAIFNCQNGILLLNTEEKMKYGVDSILHAIFQNGEKRIDFKYGINSIIPYGEDEYLVREQIIRGNSADVVRGGSLSSVSDIIDSDILLQKYTYIDDAIINLKKFEVVKIIPGTFDPHEYQNKRYLTYTSNKVALDFDPNSGNRKVLVDYRRSRKEGGNSVDIPQRGAQYFYLANRLYIVNGESPANLIQSGGKYLAKNTVFYFDENSRNWVNVIELDDHPLLTIHNHKKLIILCRQTAFEFDYQAHVLRKFEIPLKDYSWRSIGELESSYLIFGVNKSNAASVFLVSKDFKSFEPVNINGEFSNPKISTMLTPISPKQILQ